MTKSIKLVSVLFAFLWLTVTLQAQTAKEVIYSNTKISGSNHLDYPVPTQALTPAPDGYTPYYISTYARHGSRFLLDRGDYERPFKTLQEADEAGALTAEGKAVLWMVDSLRQMSYRRIGELTPLGARQHRGIAERMYKNFPTVFAENSFIDARSTVVIRCILSMLNECTTLMSLNPSLELTTDASEHDMFYMNNNTPQISKVRRTPEARNSVEEYAKKRFTNSTRLMNVLFADKEYLESNINGSRLMDQLQYLAVNVQSHDVDFDLLSFFTPEECYDYWLQDNYGWYVDYGPSPLTNGFMPFSQANLLSNIIATADSCLQLPRTGATLRFGHEVCVLPLACLLELNECGYSTANPDSLAAHWRNYEIFPMGCNVQLIFYTAQGKPTLVKALLNEREATLPIGTDMFPYYSWDKLKEFYLKKLEKGKKMASEVKLDPPRKERN